MFEAGQQIGLYTLIEKIGSGGFGEVWLAEKRSQFVTKRVAVKLPHGGLVDFESIRQEATLWEEASGHPNVLPIIDADVYDGQAAIVSEYADGGSLADRLKAGGAFPIREAVETTIGILNGLAFLHSKNIIHRDIKPANILLQGDTPRLADFGISRAVETNTISSVIVGTESYMSPEAFEGVRSAQTDTWSVGVLLYHLLKGSLPFPQKNANEAMYAVLLKEPEPLPENVPAELRKIVFKALEKDKELNGNPPRRYQNANVMREDLQNFLADFARLNAPLPPLDLTQFVSPKEKTPPVTAQTQTASGVIDETATRVKLHIPLTDSKRNGIVQKLTRREILPFVVVSVILGFITIGWLATRLFSHNPAAGSNVSDNANRAQTTAVSNSGGEPNAVSKETTAKVKEYFDRAEKFYQRKKYDSAIDAYTKAIELTPTDYSLYNNRGLVFHTKRDYDRAIADFDKSLELSPNSLTYNNRGVAREDNGSREQAASDYRKALELNPSNELANKNLNKILNK